MFIFIPLAVLQTRVHATEQHGQCYHYRRWAFRHCNGAQAEAVPGLQRLHGTRYSSSKSRLEIYSRSIRSMRSWTALAAHGGRTFTLAGKSRLVDQVRWFADKPISSGCDIPTHLYSFSFNLNPNWSKELCDRQEILDCEFCAPCKSICNAHSS